MQTTLKQIQRNLKVQDVMQRTNCTKSQAREALIAEEWSVADAILDVKQAQTQGVIKPVTKG